VRSQTPLAGPDLTPGACGAWPVDKDGRAAGGARLWPWRYGGQCPLPSAGAPPPRCQNVSLERSWAHSDGFLASLGGVALSTIGGGGRLGFGFGVLAMSYKCIRMSRGGIDMFLPVGLNYEQS
jgi:hypothetical protein